MNTASFRWTIAARAAFVLMSSPAAMAAAQAGADDRPPCACDAGASQATPGKHGIDTQGAGAAGKHAINTKGTGNNRMTGPGATPVQQVVPAASSTGPKKPPGHVTINR